MRLSKVYAHKGVPFITIILVLLCLLISIATFIQPVLYQTLALWTIDIKPWQIISFVFEHNVEPRWVLLLHLGMNLLGLIPFGILTEKLLGHLRTFLIFIAAWLVTLGLYLIFRHGQYSSVAGISTIVYAYAAVAFIYFIKVWKIEKMKLSKQLLTYFFVVEFIGMLSLLNPMVLGGLGAAAHLSGIIVGLVAAVICRKRLSCE